MRITKRSAKALLFASPTRQSEACLRAKACEAMLQWSIVQLSFYLKWEIGLPLR